TTLVPEPLISSLVLGGSVLARAGDPAQRTRWLEPLMAGEKIVALAHAERTGRFAASSVEVRARKDGDGYVLDGEKVWVLAGNVADALVVSARLAGDPRDRAGVGLFVVDRDQAGLAIEPVRTLDGHRAAMIRLEGARVAADRLLGSGGE